MKNPDYTKVQEIISTLKGIDNLLNFLQYSSEQAWFTSPTEKSALKNASESIMNAMKELRDIKLT